MSNAYCDRLDIMPPSLEKMRAQNIELSIFEWTVFALLENGSPCSVEMLAEKLESLGIIAPSGEMVLSIKRAWHGLQPIVRDLAGCLALDLDTWRLDWLLWKTGLRREVRESDLPAAEPIPELPGPEIRLSREEVIAAFEKGTSASPLRQAAAVLDALGPRIHWLKVEEFLRGLTQYRPQISLETASLWRSPLVVVDGDGVLILNGDSADLRTVRTAIRQLARKTFERRAREKHQRAIGAVYGARRKEREQKESEEATRRRKALLHALPANSRKVPTMFGLLDIGMQEVRVFEAPHFEELRAILANFDVVVGLEVRTLLERLGLDVTHWRLVDLSSPKKTRILNRSGRKLRITPELLITSTTGTSRTLADPAKVARYVAEGSTSKLAHRLEADIWALLAYYRFGALHNYVRLRWGFLDESIGVNWALPGEKVLYAVLMEAKNTGTEVEFVLGNTPGRSNPWSRAIRGRCVDLQAWHATFEINGELTQLMKHEFQAIRFVEGTP